MYDVNELNEVLRIKECRSSQLRCYIKKAALKNYSCVGVSFLIKLQPLRRLQHRCFPMNIAKFLRTPILKNICERLLLRVAIFKSGQRMERIRGQGGGRVDNLWLQFTRLQVLLSYCRVTRISCHIIRKERVKKFFRT